MKPHPHFSQLAVLMWLDEAISACAFHGAGEVDLQFRVVACLERRDAKHWYSVITRRYGSSNGFTDSSALSQRNHREARWHCTAEDDLCIGIVGRQSRVGRSNQHEPAKRRRGRKGSHTICDFHSTQHRLRSRRIHCVDIQTGEICGACWHGATCWCFGGDSNHWLPDL